MSDDEHLIARRERQRLSLRNWIDRDAGSRDGRFSHNWHDDPKFHGHKPGSRVVVDGRTYFVNMAGECLPNPLHYNADPHKYDNEYRETKYTRAAVKRALIKEICRFHRIDDDKSNSDGIRDHIRMEMWELLRWMEVNLPDVEVGLEFYL